MISRNTFNAHTEPIFKQLKVLNLYNIYWFQIGKIVFVKDKPSSWCSNNIIFVFKSQSLWQSLHSPCKTNIKQCALCFQGPKFCNSLNIEIQNDGTLSWSLNCEHYLSQLPSYSSWFVNLFLFFCLLFSPCWSICLFWVPAIVVVV